MLQKPAYNTPYPIRPKEVNPPKPKPQETRPPPRAPAPKQPQQPDFNKPLLKLEMYEPKTKEQVPTFNAPANPLYLGNNKQFMPNVLPYLFQPNYAISQGPNVQLPMQQVYNIHLPGPTGNHVEMSRIYETLLPGKENKLTANTLGERLQMYEYIRQILIKSGDGEEASLDNAGQHNLMSYIKFLELNPTFYSPIFSNPYQGLPYGLLVYRSCFPIRFDPTSQTIACSKESIGLNVRLYALSIAEYMSYKYRQPIFKQYDVWRELAFYEYIREKVLKKKQCPNFPLLYCYFLCNNKNVDFFSLKKNCLTHKDYMTKDYAAFVARHKEISALQSSKAIIRPIGAPEANRPVPVKLPDEIDPQLQAYSGNTMAMITESPNYNLFQWASRTYIRDGIARKMISQGFYNADIWLGVLFQITAALATLQIHEIYIKDMTIADNVYIKDLQISGAAQGYWKYIVNGISYYVPNYGYLVMIDSNFKDIQHPAVTLQTCKRPFKIEANLPDFKSDSSIDYTTKVWENYQSIINTNNFTKEHTQNNVNKPPEAIMDLIGKMMNDSTKDLTRVLSKYFTRLMNNRIGTYLRRDTEVPYIRDITTEPKVGEMLVLPIAADTYIWVMVVEHLGNNLLIYATRQSPDDEDIIEQTGRVDSFKQYSPSEKIEQNSSVANNLSEDALLETYIVSK